MPLNPETLTMTATASLSAPPVPFDAPNLDACDDETDLLALADVFYDFNHYAELRAAAIRRRERGAVAAALSAERRAEAIYKNLPAWARW